MLRKYRYLALGITVMLLVVAACLLLPGFLLNLEGQRDVGKVTRATQEYNADNVSAALDFNLQTRLLMLSGQWQCRDTVIREDEVNQGDRILSQEDMNILGGNALVFFTQFLLESSLGLDMMNQAVNRMDASAWRYFAQATGYTEEALGVMAVELQEMYILKHGGAGEVYSLSLPDIPSMTSPFENLFYYGATFDVETTLHRYEDQILDAYYFYVWEYTVNDPIMDYTFTLMMDAVTLEVYSMKFEGALFEGLTWLDVFDEIAGELTVQEYDSSADVDLWSFYTDIPTDVILYYWMILWPGVLQWIPDSDVWELFPVGVFFIYSGEEPYTEESGYNFPDGNLFLSQIISFQSRSGPRDDTLLLDDGEMIFIEVDDDQGISWALSASA